MGYAGDRGIKDKDGGEMGVGKKFVSNLVHPTPPQQPSSYRYYPT